MVIAIGDNVALELDNTIDRSAMAGFDTLEGLDGDLVQLGVDGVAAGVIEVGLDGWQHCPVQFILSRGEQLHQLTILHLQFQLVV